LRVAALLSDAPRNADVRALGGGVTLYALAKTDLEKAVAAFPELARQLWAAMRPAAKKHAESVRQHSSLSPKRALGSKKPLRGDG
jgi:CRP-like cAMP-binding protein